MRIETFEFAAASTFVPRTDGLVYDCTYSYIWQSIGDILHWLHACRAGPISAMMFIYPPSC